MKEFYVLNLDRKRIMILAGILFIILSLVFLAGSLKGSASEVSQNSFSDPGHKNQGEGFDLQSFIENKSGKDRENENTTEKIQQQNDPFSLSEEKKYSREELNEVEKKYKIPVEDDPLIYSPRAKKSRESKQQLDGIPVVQKKKKSVKNKRKTSKKTITADDEEEFSTSRVARKKSIRQKKQSGKYAIQYAAYKHEKDAHSYRQKLNKAGIKTHLVRGKTLYYSLRSTSSVDRDKLKSRMEKNSGYLDKPAIIVHTKS